MKTRPQSRVILTLAALAAASCSQGANPASPSALRNGAAIDAAARPDAAGPGQQAQGTGARFESFFSAIAACSAEIGRIQFSGTVEGIDQTTLDGRGETHRIRQFRVHGLTAVNLDTGTTYTVIGGAEMLSWNSQKGQLPGVSPRSTHAGTLVFAPDNGGPNVIAHHSIRYVENAKGEVVVQLGNWRCVTAR